jgi:hypothetical protein
MPVTLFGDKNQKSRRGRKAIPLLRPLDNRISRGGYQDLENLPQHTSRSGGSGSNARIERDGYSSDIGLNALTSVRSDDSSSHCDPTWTSQGFSSII